MTDRLPQSAQNQIDADYNAFLRPHLGTKDPSAPFALKPHALDCERILRLTCWVNNDEKARDFIVEMWVDENFHPFRSMGTCSRVEDAVDPDTDQVVIRMSGTQPGKIIVSCFFSVKKRWYHYTFDFFDREGWINCMPGKPREKYNRG
uniref:Uncharacterized protein n=1 Tax=Pithovirus LCPAC304 TaxID=2506594 RepID=A0A481Z7K9_9VIRU|nr:MAG: hypothetical protein LCPAC304_01930 [Pithovirus LCPAC304]